MSYNDYWKYPGANPPCWFLKHRECKGCTCRCHNVKITKIDEHNYDVGEYMVHLDPESCCCMDWTIRGAKKGHQCKHLKAVKEKFNHKDNTKTFINSGLLG